MIAIEEQAALQRAYGRIEPRKRFKGQSAQPINEGREVNYIFVDESGTSSPGPPNLPQVFALGAVAFTTEDHQQDYIRRANELKRNFFGTSDITFHEPGIRQHIGLYYFGGIEKTQEEFDMALSQLIEESEFVVFGAAIRKDAFSRDFVDAGLDPYLPTNVYAVAITMLIERYVDYLAMTDMPKSMGRATFESIGPKEDAQHQLDYVRLLLEGSQWVSDSSFRNWLETGLRFIPKRGSNPMELADMVARELYEWVRDGCATEKGRWPLFSKKVYCRGDGLMGTFGVKVFPDSDIREQVMNHRWTNGAVRGRSEEGD